ncbi:26S proteasome non-ATPase regulatory subunit 10-like [Octopus sinensis]|uniref:26S proteasome non-ATPase regulatory subunit 10-like n=1 Tax=Octopus sinensis TaxID=2607531 RepID=A0A7E6EM67_9MOLL|nr:26S proteasome non-ATPase regulatory subunit 10-like [Octopus sinensis]XP_036356056.1 26S proteasome non-ATPase regulatory subunit 10-like [Octopus sinensis]
MKDYRIFDIIRDGDIEKLQTLLKKEPGQIQQRFVSGVTPLMWACEVGADRRIIEILIEAGGEIGANDNDCWSALHCAVYGHRLQAVELLIARGSNVNEKNNFGCTPLHLATEWTDGVKALRKQSAVKVNARSNNGRTPLHLACSRGHLHTVEMLLGHNGIDANVVDDNGDTPLHVAVQRQRNGVVSLLLNQGSFQVDIPNHQRMTPLLEAVSRGHLGMTQKLIALGANINAVDGEGNSCLHIAVKTEVFNSEDAPLDLLNECCTALKMKKKRRLSGVVVARYLARQGADFYHRNNNNNTPLELIKDLNLRKKLEAFLPPQ